MKGGAGEGKVMVGKTNVALERQSEKQMSHEEKT